MTERDRFSSSCRKIQNRHCVFVRFSRNSNSSRVNRVITTLLLKLLPLLSHVVVLEVDVNYGAVHMRMAHALLHVGGVPGCANQLGCMGMSQHVRVKWKFVLAAVVLKHRFHCMAVQRATISNRSALVSRCLLEDHEQVIGIKVVLQNELIQKSH